MFALCLNTPTRENVACTAQPGGRAKPKESTRHSPFAIRYPPFSKRSSMIGLSPDHPHK